MADEVMLSERAADDSERAWTVKMGERGERGERVGSSSDWGAERDARWEEKGFVGERTDRWDVEECFFFCEEGTRKGDARERLGLGGAVLETAGWTGGAGSVVDGAGFGDGRVRIDSREVRRKEPWGGRGRAMGGEGGANAEWRRLQQVSTGRERRQKHTRWTVVGAECPAS